jgi:hypothetical protein
MRAHRWPAAAADNCDEDRDGLTAAKKIHIPDERFTFHETRKEPCRYFVAMRRGLALVIAVLALLGAANGIATASASTRWHELPNQPVAGHGLAVLSAATCATSTFCIAVGGNHGRPLIERQVGHRWRIVVQGGAGSALGGVSCKTSTMCIAVGRARSVETWNGHRWIFSQSLKLRSDTLSAVSCPAMNSCFAVGGGFSRFSRVLGPLVEHWDGTRWAEMAQPTGSSDFEPLTSISCTSTTFCMAVGGMGTKSHPVIERWNGSVWTLLPGGGPFAVWLYGVACTSTTWCMAVGDDGSIRHWNGRHWVGSKAPPRKVPLMSAMSCASKRSCVAVGEYQDFGKTLIERWNGSHWTNVIPDDASHTGTARYALFGVASAEKRYIAVGWAETRADNDHRRPLVEAS